MKKIKLITLIGLPILALTIMGTLFAAKSFAFTPNYNPSNLIDDPTLLNNQTMSEGAIQSFLTNIGSGLANFSDIEACSASTAPYYSHCGETISAAQIIYDASQAYSINPRAILATLEKEQTLVTDPSPTSAQLNCAMGYESCSSNFVGFFTQVDNGAWQLRLNEELASGNSYWGYAPSSYLCGNSNPSFYNNGLLPGNTVTFVDAGGTPETVTIDNAATAALYCYTPYVGPMSVTGYSGSYNFVYYYQLWFGSTQATIAYSWNVESQTAYLDPGHTELLTANATVEPGSDIYMQVQARNVGYQTWDQGVVNLGTSNPDDRTSQFYDSNWLNAARPAELEESTVTPGSVGTYNFILHAPQATGSYFEYFNLVADGITWLNDPGLYYAINVVLPVQATNSTNTELQTGQTLTTGKYLLSPDSQSVLSLQSNGSLELYSNFAAFWSPGAVGSMGDLLAMQSDGNLVLYGSNGQALWASNTAGNSGAYLALQTDGNLVIYSSSGTALWNTDSAQNPNHLDYVNTSMSSSSTSSDLIFPGQMMQTANRQYTAVLQPDGNFVVYNNSKGQPVWSSNTGSNVAYGAMQSDGNFVLYSQDGTPIWDTDTSGGPSSLTMQPDGNLVIYNTSGDPVWATIR